MTDQPQLIELPLIGPGFRRPIADWILSCPSEISCVEVTAEHFFDTRHQRVLAGLARIYPLSVHGLGLSLGTPGRLDAQTLTKFVRVVRTADPKWISEHVAFTRTDEVDLGHLNPVACTPQSLEILSNHARELMDMAEKPLLLENITSFLPLPGDMPETEFLNRLCQDAQCGLLLDVTNLMVNARNHCFDPLEWLREIEPGFIRQLHVVGYSEANGVWSDRHAEPIQADLFALLEEVIRYAPVQSIIVERDVDFPSVKEFARELGTLETICECVRSDQATGEAVE
jgi:uncharacterized protein (UPF0276 family)